MVQRTSGAYVVVNLWRLLSRLSQCLKASVEYRMMNGVPCRMLSAKLHHWPQDRTQQLNNSAGSLNNSITLLELDDLLSPNRDVFRDVARVHDQPTLPNHESIVNG